MSWGQTGSAVEFDGTMALHLLGRIFFLMLKVWPMCAESTWGEAIFMLSRSCFAKGVSWGLDSSLIFFGAKSSLPTLWRAFLATRLVFFLLRNFLIWFPVDVASLLPNLWNICFFPWCLERGAPFLSLNPFAPLRMPFRMPFVLPSPNISSTRLSPREARAPIAVGIPICLRSGRPLEMSAGGIANPPLCMIGSLVICIWFRILSSSPFPNNAGSKLNPASAQGKPPLCIIICCLIGSDICFCSSPGPSPNSFPNKPNIPPCCLSDSPSPNNFPNKPIANIPPCWRLRVLNHHHANG